MTRQKKLLQHKSNTKSKLYKKKIQQCTILRVVESVSICKHRKNKISDKTNRRQEARHTTNQSASAKIVDQI